MAKSSLLMRADPSGGGSRWLLMVARSSLNSAWRAGKERRKGSFWNFAFAHVFLHSKTALDDKSTCVTVSFFRAELYCSSERSGSPLGNVRRGDLAAISQTPSYHSSGQSPAGTTSLQSDSSFHHKHENMGFFAHIAKSVTCWDARLPCSPEPSTAKPMTTEYSQKSLNSFWRRGLASLIGGSRLVN